MTSLSDAITRTRLADVYEAHEGTFEWLFDPAAVCFSDWLRDISTSDHSPIFWIQGKLGSGNFP